MSDFKWRHFRGEIILWGVRWCCKYGISYRNLEEMLAERGVSVDHTTLYRWVQHYAPEMERRLRWCWKRPSLSRSWRVDETYIKVKGEWAYLYRALDKGGDTIDFCLSPTRNTKAAKRFLGKALKGLKDWEMPVKINTDKAPTYGAAIAELKKAGKLPDETQHPIKGFEVMHALRKGQERAFCLQPGIRGEVRLVKRAFGLGPSALAEAAQIVADHYQMAA